MMSAVLHVIQLANDNNDDSHIYVIPLLVYGPSELEIKDTTDTDTFL